MATVGWDAFGHAPALAGVAENRIAFIAGQLPVVARWKLLGLGFYDPATWGETVVLTNERTPVHRHTRELDTRAITVLVFARSLIGTDNRRHELSAGTETQSLGSIPSHPASRARSWVSKASADSMVRLWSRRLFMFVMAVRSVRYEKRTTMPCGK